MLSRSVVPLFLLLCLPLFFAGCSDDSVTPTGTVNIPDTSGFVYPFTLGSSWTYTTKEYASDIHPDSILHYFSNYPLTWNGSVTILYDTLINDTLTRCFLEVISDAQRTRNSRSYMINNDTALLMYAQRGGGFLVNPPEDKLGNLKYNLDFGSDETIRIYNPPYTILNYPVVTGKTWYIYGVDTITITKKYEGYEIITTGTGSFNCMKTKTTYSFFPESPYYDYYCKYGLLKRTVTFNDIVITNEWFPEGMGTADLSFITTVNTFIVR